jgi:hypothetical protein
MHVHTIRTDSEGIGFLTFDTFRFWLPENLRTSLRGHLTATFPYILGHLEYIVGELLRNSIKYQVTISSNT